MQSDPIYTQYKAPTYLEALSDSAEDSVLVVQPGRGHSRDEELGAVGARPTVRHRHCEGAVVSVCACIKQEDVRSKCADSSNNIIYSCIVLEYTYIYTYIHLTYKLLVEYSNHIKTQLVSVKTFHFHSIIECKISAFAPTTTTFTHSPEILVELVLKFPAPDGLATGAVALGVSSLQHEALDDSMEQQPTVVVQYRIDA